MRKVLLVSLCIVLISNYIMTYSNAYSFQISSYVEDDYKYPKHVYPYIKSPLDSLRTYMTMIDDKYIEKVTLERAVIEEDGRLWLLSEPMNEEGLAFKYRILNKTIHINLHSQEVRDYVIGNPSNVAFYLYQKYKGCGYDFWIPEIDDFSIYDLGLEIAGHAILADRVKVDEDSDQSEYITILNEIVYERVAYADSAFGREVDGDLTKQIALEYYKNEYGDASYPYEH